MLRYLTIVFIVKILVNNGNCFYPGPRHPATQGEVWPKPQQEVKSSEYCTYKPATFEVLVTGHTCALLDKAIQNHMDRLKALYEISRRYTGVDRGTREKLQNNYMGFLKELDVELSSECEDLPYMDMNEKYTLSVANKSRLESASIWGIIRGLDTFTQLFYLANDYTEVRVNSTQIVDFPRYAYRGLMLDTSRHYFSEQTILKTLDAMAMNKLNVFHWHIVDHESFPYVSHKFPELSEKGAFHPSMVYSPQFLAQVVRYAAERGIRVVPEFDVPDHTRSWGQAFPQILTSCSNDPMDLGPMNPISNLTYSVLADLFEETFSRFPDKYFHLGGDEVDLKCWSNSDPIRKYMKEHNMTDPKELLELFMHNVFPILKNRKAIVWQEVFDLNVHLPKNSLIQVWKWNDVGDWVKEMVKILKAGHLVLFSSNYYLDHLNQNFADFYLTDPRQIVEGAVNQTLQANIVGGEACMWGEMVDDQNVMTRLVGSLKSGCERMWPHTSAVAEVLWSTLQKESIQPEHSKKLPELVLRRIEEHACRMIRFGVPTQPPSAPGFCLA